MKGDLMGNRRNLTTVVIGLVLLALMISLTNVAVSDSVPTPPPVPGVPTITPVPTTPPSGGGGYTPPQEVYPKVIPVKNSLGIIIGNVTATSPSNIVLNVGDTIVVNGQEVIISIEARLNSLPYDPKMDIVGEALNSSKIPDEISLRNVLAQVNLTRFSSGWNVQFGSLKITLKGPNALIGNADLSKSLLVRYDGLQYELLYPSVAGPDSNGTMTFTVISPNETLKYGSFAEYALVTGLLPTTTPTPTPSVSPTPGPGGIQPLTILLALLLVLIVAAGFILFFWMQRKH